ncbi:MAG TPA: hypothetical protein VMO26_06370 [Vicinamibacterales bacterium]|nr:hypothetical protein [Vicinamibacterales bacterium]
MRSAVQTLLCAAGVALAFMMEGGAQAPGPSSQSDPRIGLKGGLTDADVAAKGLELVSNLPKPEGFIDPSGNHSLNFANSDLAFQDNHVFLGNFAGFNIYDVENTRKPRVVTSIVCPGGQGDLSVYGNLLFMSVEQTRGRIDCGVDGVEDPVSKERFRGVRIFDITDIDKPRQVAAVQTCRGSHTHTLVPDPKDKAAIYIYGSGTGGSRQGEELEGCVPDAKDANTALFSIDVIKVPLANPEQAAIVSRPRIFSDPATGAAGGLWQGGDHGPGTQRTATTNQCHDITAYPEIGLAAGACSGNGLLLDISDPLNPTRLDAASDKNFAYWHSASFNNDGTKVIFTDEWGGGTRPRCRATDLPTWGANAIFDVVDKKLVFRSYYKLPVAQTEQENCVAHNGSLIPVPGRDIKAQGWYQGGVSVFDFTDSANPIEIAYFDRGPVNPQQLVTGGYWSAYWYNGHLYGSEIARGIDIFRLVPTEHLTQAEIDAAVQVRSNEFNVQSQPRIEHPLNFITARAYVDQLARSKALTAERAGALRSAMDRADRSNAPRADLEAVTNLANQIEKEAASATGVDGERMKALAATIKGRVTRLR